jgi:tryptophan synthase alpha chain
MSKIQQALSNQKSFIAFVTANDPDLETTVQNVLALAEGGADLVEIGIPFSDPVADGPVIQKADVRALKDPNLPVNSIFEAVQKIRQQSDVPLAFLVYCNMVFQYGYDAFTAACAKYGVDGLIIPDLPYEEQGELTPYTKKHGIDLIPLVTSQSGDRIPRLVKGMTGFVYLVSSNGVTGQRSEEDFSQNLDQLVNSVRRATDLPIEIGFGIHSPKQANEMAALADGAIVGSACVAICEQYGRQAPAHLKDYAQEMVTAIRG